MGMPRKQSPKANAQTRMDVPQTGIPRNLLVSCVTIVLRITCWNLADIMSCAATVQWSSSRWLPGAAHKETILGIIALLRRAGVGVRLVVWSSNKRCASSTEPICSDSVYNADQHGVRIASSRE